MSTSVTSPGAPRLYAVFALVLVLIGSLALPAAATEAEGGAPVEEEGPAPGVNEIGTQSKTSKQFLPEETELPPFQQWLYVPMAIAGFLIIGALLYLYLMWQPRFAEERRSKRRR